jgi:hypothetical protein
MISSSVIICGNIIPLCAKILQTILRYNLPSIGLLNGQKQKKKKLADLLHIEE